MICHNVVTAAGHRVVASITTSVCGHELALMVPLCCRQSQIGVTVIASRSDYMRQANALRQSTLCINQSGIRWRCSWKTRVKGSLCHPAVVETGRPCCCHSHRCAVPSMPGASNPTHQAVKWATGMYCANSLPRTPPPKTKAEQTNCSTKPSHNYWAL